MKKKGLIISTVVMVVVLIASLTTATYAWFTTSAVTKIEGFDVSIESLSLVKIGMKKDATYNANATQDSFVTGDVTTTVNAPGVFGVSGFTGTTGMSMSLNHDIEWRAQSAAIGATTVQGSTSASDYGLIGDKLKNKGADDVVYIYSANLDANDSTNATLTTPVATVANKTDSGNGDYVYMFLGVTPAKDLAKNELIIMIKGDQNVGSTVGILSAIHVAYRLNSGDASAWEDVAIMKGMTYGTLYSKDMCNLTDEQKAAYREIDAAETFAGCYALFIELPTLKVGPTNIDQIELAIYIAGSDTNCVNAATGASGSIKIFFNCQEASATE